MIINELERNKPKILEHEQFSNKKRHWCKWQIGKLVEMSSTFQKWEKMVWSLVLTITQISTPFGSMLLRQRLANVKTVD